MAGFDLATLRTDKTKEVEGVWMEYMGESRLKIARLRNSKMEEFLLSKQTSAARRHNDPQYQLRTFRRAVAKFVLLGWEKLFLDDVEQTYNEDLAYEIFQDYPDFYETVLDMSQEVDAFKYDNKEEDSGNSPASSSGS